MADLFGRERSVATKHLRTYLCRGEAASGIQYVQVADLVLIHG